MIILRTNTEAPSSVSAVNAGNQFPLNKNSPHLFSSGNNLGEVAPKCQIIKFHHGYFSENGPL